MGACRVGHCRLRKGRRRREGIGRVSCAGLCGNLFQIVCMEWTVTKLKALSSALSFENLREISRFIGRDLKALQLG